MKIEVLKRSHIKRNIIIVIVVIAIISAIILNFSSAKYRVSDSVPIINSEINYKVADLNMVSLYVKSGEGEYIEEDTIPSSGYTLNIEQSYCGLSNNGEIVKDDSISIVYENGLVNVLGISKKGTKCYLYFDIDTSITVQELIASYTNKLTRSNFSTAVTDTTTGTIYYETTSAGTTYYFAGAPTDNWVSFAGFYWRIIRINEDESIRIIYSGDEVSGPITTGEGTQIGTSAFNYTYRDNTYEGYMMGLDNQCTSGSCSGSTRTSSYSQSVSNRYDSTIKTVLDNWYENNLLEYSSKISQDAGFCGDRTYTSGYAYGTSSTEYSTKNRLNNDAPSLDCPDKNDLYTVSNSNGNGALIYPIGLISVDEVIYGGLVGGAEDNYLCTSQHYWTMSPYNFNGSRAFMTFVFRLGYPTNVNGYVYSTYGVRPVINLSPDVNISGSGTQTDPYVITE